MSRPRFDPLKFGIYLLLSLFALVFLVPVYVMLSSSLKTFSEVQDMSRMWAPPRGIHLESFQAAWFGVPEKGLRGLSQNILNSFGAWRHIVGADHGSCDLWSADHDLDLSQLLCGGAQ